jgi:hypothetical protein
MKNFVFCSNTALQYFFEMLMYVLIHFAFKKTLRLVLKQNTRFYST